MKIFQRMGFALAQQTAARSRRTAEASLAQLKAMDRDDALRADVGEVARLMQARAARFEDPNLVVEMRDAGSKG